MTDQVFPRKKGPRFSPPRASAMLEALRGLGYSPETAIADIVDNSIAAGATEIAIQFDWDGPDSRISILDNGKGMSSDELDLAMMLGGRSPLDDRTSDDLGRFGLGLKTASFSQCRCLTVATSRADIISCLRWDLDELADAHGTDWLIHDGPRRGSAQFLEPLGGVPHGTLVLWEVMDRVVSAGTSEQHFLDLIDQVEAHLRMTFHRFLEADEFSLSINGNPLKAWDPFMSRNLATWSSPPLKIRTFSGFVEVQGFVLPHKDRLDAKQLDDGAGPHGWTAQQGFYVYRNRRLLVAGSWLGLGSPRQWRKEEPFRLARLRLDIPNNTDSDWHIDVRKSSARPPAPVRDALIQIAEDVRNRARRVFAHRGSSGVRAGREEVAEVWQLKRLKDGVRYQIDETHPAVAAVLDQGKEAASTVRAMLRVIEETVPVQRIWLDTAEQHETPRTGFSGEPTAEVSEVLRTLFSSLVRRKGLSPEAARAQLLRTEPFQNFPDLVADLDDPSSSEE